MKVKRILSLILSLTLMLTGCISVSLAEEPEAEEPLESDNELSVIMEEEIEIVQAEALLGAAPEEEPEKDAEIPTEEDIPGEDESAPPAEEDLKEDEGIPADEDEPEGEPAESAEEPVAPEVPTEESSEEPGADNPELPEDLIDEPTDLPPEEPTEEPAEEPVMEPVEEPIEEPMEDPEKEPEPVEEPVEEPEKEPETIEEPVEEPVEEEPVEEEPEELPPHQAGDFVQVTKDTWVFTDMDKTEEASRIKSDLFVGVFVRDAVVQIKEVLRTSCTVTDYAYTRDQLMQRTSSGRKALRSFSPTAMDGFSLKEIHVNLGSFEAWQSGLNGSSGKDSDYPQIAKSSAHGTIYATPHYLAGFEVY